VEDQGGVISNVSGVNMQPVVGLNDWKVDC
jgi:hypothetical protein